MKNACMPLVLAMDTAAGARGFARLLQNRRARDAKVGAGAEAIIAGVRERGDTALFAYAAQFDNVTVNAKTVRLDPRSFKALAAQVPAPLAQTIREAASRIREYHSCQGVARFELISAEGSLSQIVRPLRRVGLYVPGGHTIYPSSILMNAIPARLAGVREIAAVTPCRGGLHPLLAFAFDLMGIDEVYGIGGAHGVAALAYGTRSVPAVDKIVGPGNAWVAAAKRAVYGDVDIDMVAGPSEIAILADSSTPAEWVALDMLAQAEHGSGDEMAVCITENISFAQEVVAALEQQIELSESKELFGRLAKGALCICVTASRQESYDLINTIAPEHLELLTKNARRDLKHIDNAGAVFIGRYTTVAMGDYFIGTNHVLPTGAAARFASPLGVDDFQKRISVAEITAQGLASCAPHVSRFARAEGFVHHALSVERRVKPSAASKKSRRTKG